MTMTLLEKIQAIQANYGHTLRVTLRNGKQFTGVFTDYTWADDNEEGVASIDIRVEKGEPEYCLFENEIDTIERT